MSHFSLPHTARLAALLLAATSLAACGDTLTRLSRVGQEPPITPVQNPAERQGYVSMPMPTPVAVERSANSLWRQGARSFFKDNRASQVGDIVTVTINRTDTATLAQDTRRRRTSTEDTDVTNLLGYENTIWNRLPGSQGTISPASLLSLGTATDNRGQGDLSRSEALNLKVAAVVTQVLPNGNLVIHGSQEMRINFETRVVQVGGVVRPSDIRTNVSGTAGANDNEIAFERIAEARLTYGGRGQFTEIMQPRWGTQLLDILMPF